MQKQLSEWKSTERARVKDGKMPFFVKKCSSSCIPRVSSMLTLPSALFFISHNPHIFLSPIYSPRTRAHPTATIKQLSAVDEYEDLKKRGKLESYMATRRKKNMAKDHRYLPYARRDNGTD